MINESLLYTIYPIHASLFFRLASLASSKQQQSPLVKVEVLDENYLDEGKRDCCCLLVFSILIWARQPWDLIGFGTKKGLAILRLLTLLGGKLLFFMHLINHLVL